MRFLFLKLPVLITRTLFYLAVFLSPVLGVWLASSVVAYINGPKLLTVFSGILLFPLVPILWDMGGRKRRKELGILTWGDRIVLKTLVLNLAFLFLLLALRPQTSFLALSTRGDWFLDGMQGPQVELARTGLFTLSRGLEGLYLRFHNNPFDQYADTTQVKPQPAPQPQPTGQAGQSKGWPWTEVGLHPAVVNMPPSAETSIASVAQYIASQEKDPMLRVKALHDYVADRIAYDAPNYFAGNYPPQDAETVFQRRVAVCAGYAKLLEALGQAIGEEIVYVVGDSRSSTSDLEGQSHAWNAAKIKGQWYLIDTTWDSGSVDRASGFKKAYKTDYLFPPPEVMGISHFPDDENFQLRSQPISRGEFLRQPMMRARFFAEGMQLVAPMRSQSDTHQTAVIQLQNPNQRWLLPSYSLKGSTQAEHCLESATQGPQITCSLPGPGAYEVSLFSGDEQYGEFAYVGQVEFNRR
ncbi:MULTISPECIES: transglutaminase domain-containing protein [Cyanophyceae]|uniref:transglutaminase domain-containing protein n=1 Tax=Cyanophyceae TaxID=3028117 RepID=UPI0016865397|nr:MULTISPECIES: transglutaminase domain-containing protein [Cyanophyceae]MBD1918310.1 transglutaminase [Phormidium sp. FACHB-77]MBD2028826.1 transglutaminase [Phormidium sp. FACHB-322]MBD2051247.1 transglutaminase [Leptolyngbya sp. FACHB-60]